MKHRICILILSVILAGFSANVTAADSVSQRATNIAISPREGLDLAHVAIAYEQNGEMHFIHASYGAKKVIIEPKTLADYATNGIRISRLR